MLHSVGLWPLFDGLYNSYFVAGMKTACRRMELDCRWLRKRRFGFPIDRADHLRGIAKRTSGRIVRFLIDSYDSSEVDPEELLGVDRWFKVNYSEEICAKLPDRERAKVVPIGPSFGIRGLSVVSLPGVLAAVACLVPARASFLEQTKGLYRQTRYRRPLDFYERDAREDGPVFFAGSLWRKEAAINAQRVRIIGVCREVFGDRFEGGMAPRRDGWSPYPHTQMPRRLEPEVYFAKVSRSPLAFNTRGVLDCFGWKLAEYMAMGKAIISTPWFSKPPAPITHGLHVHLVREDLSDLRDAVDRILGDESYRARLKAGARSYYRDNLEPARVAERCLRSLGSL